MHHLRSGSVLFGWAFVFHGLYKYLINSTEVLIWKLNCLQLRSVRSVNGCVRSRDRLHPTMSRVLVSPPPIPLLASMMESLEPPPSQQQLRLDAMNLPGDMGTASLEEKSMASQVRLQLF